MINTKTNTSLKSLFLIAIFICFFSCQKNEPLSFHKRTIAINDYFDCKSSDCAITEIFLLESINETEIAKKINVQIEKAACTNLNVEDDTAIDNIEEALKNFNNSYQEIKKEFPEEIIPYEASINCDISYQNKFILSVLIDSYIFTGGAHGSGNSNYINIDTKTGAIISHKKLLKDVNNFSIYVEKVFREKYDIPKEQSINSTGFFFDNNTFSLPNNIGITETYIILFYNQYEISSYAEGPIELKLKKEEVADYFTTTIL
ncbi:PdaC/SigV domain-containing protein [Aquimarina sp. LLG6339-5]|uniref:DUF3298 and DUF4163 domain-containing protein n=1 Tax=Aquimarina sp. LLG6339-5 TaxID=3160830 RepID=UPI00386956D6